MQTDDPSEFLSDGLWRKRSVKNGKVKLTNTKEIARYIQRAGNYDKALLKVILETDSTKFPEASVSNGMALLNVDSSTPIHSCNQILLLNVESLRVRCHTYLHVN